MKKSTLLFSVLFLLGIGIAKAQISNLYSWTGITYPHGSLTISGNVMYGMTQDGGTSNRGVIFSINKDGSNYQTIWNFDDTGLAYHANGSNPQGSLLLVGNRLYGITSNGGSGGFGNVFSINTNGTGYRDLWDFQDSGSISGIYSGEFPRGTLALSGSKLFGFTQHGGANSDGTIFSMDTLGHHYRDLHDFVLASGTYPSYGSLAVSVSGTILYGTAYDGGVLGNGSVFSIDTNGTHYHDLHDFNVSDGQYPYGSVVLSGTKLFGMTQAGGAGWGDGTIFSMDTGGYLFKNVVNFTGATGANPYGAVTLDGSKLYGMTSGGGLYGDGVVFSIDSNGTGYTDLGDMNGLNGYDPFGSISISGDTLFGMAFFGGNNGYGNIFRVVDTSMVTGVNSVHATAAALTLYPNPSNGVFTVSIRNEELGIMNNVEVYNVIGDKVYSQSLIPNSSFLIDLSLQPAGLYFVSVITNKGYLVGKGKVIIQK